MLIVNADDWGRDEATTRAILACFEAGTITSATAMVHMAGSAHGAREGAGLPLGLHLNLTAPFDAPSCPAPVRERQAAVARFLTGRGYRRWLLQPQWIAAVRTVVCDQLDEFRRLHGRDPTHLDGHHHTHVWPTVLAAGALPRGLPVRRSFTFEPSEKPAANRAVRRMLNAAVARRHPTTQHFMSVRTLPSFQRPAAAPCERLRRSARESTEVMVHPDRPDEERFLRTDAWRDSLHALPLGTYADLGQDRIVGGE